MKLEQHLKEAEITAKLKSQTEFTGFTYWQIIYSVYKNPGKECKEIAAMLVQPEWKIFRIVERYNNQGKSFEGAKQRGGRRVSTSFLTLEGEKELLSGITEKALNGLVLTYNDIKKEVEAKLRSVVSDDYIWDLFKRHGWKKKAPRPQHPLKDPVKGEEFKKNSKRTWQP